MKVDVWIVLDPKQPGRAMVSPTPPTAERASILRTNGCEVWHALVRIPTDIFGAIEKGIIESDGTPCRYLGQPLHNENHAGRVVSETGTEVVVEWSNGMKGTFSIAAFEGALQSQTLKWGTK